MKLYIKQKVFSIRDKYHIYDINQNSVYNVVSELFAIPAKFHLYNTLGQEEYNIKKKFTMFLSRYEIYERGVLSATVSQEFALFRAKLNVESRYGHFDIKGNFFGMDFEIYKNGQYFGSIHKKWLSWGDCYEIDIPNEENAGFICALVIAIDNCIHNENNK